MKTIRVLCFLLWVAVPLHSVKAQYGVVPSVPPSPFTFHDLWQVTVSRAQADSYTKFYLAMRVFDGQGQLRVKSNSANFALETGSRYFHLGNLYELQPFSTSFTDAGTLQQAVSSGGVFPPGQYRVVYTLYGKAADGEFAPLAEDFLEATVDVAWPPMLLSPTDGEVIETVTPFLTWTPAFAAGFQGQIQYRLRLAEVLKGQNGYQAIASNPALLTEKGISVTTLAYPAGARVLEAEKTYVWQVHAYSDGTELGQSEIWTFSLGKPKEDPVTKTPRYYIKPSRKVSAEYVRLQRPELPVALEEGYFPTTGRLRFTILNEQMETVAVEKDFEAVVKTGLNTYVISLCSHNSRITLKKGRYILELLAGKNERLYIPFELEKGGRCNE